MREIPGPNQPQGFNRRPKFSSELGPPREVLSPSVTADLGPVKETAGPVINPAIHVNTGGAGPAAAAPLLQSQTVADILGGPAYEYTQPAAAPVATDSQGAPLYGSAGAPSASRVPATAAAGGNSVTLDSGGWKPMDDGPAPSRSLSQFQPAGGESSYQPSPDISLSDPAPVPDSLAFVGQSLSESDKISSSNLPLTGGSLSEARPILNTFASTGDSLSDVSSVPSTLDYTGESLSEPQSSLSLVQSQPASQPVDRLPIDISAALSDPNANTNIYLPPARDAAPSPSSSVDADNLRALFRGDQEATSPAVRGSGSSAGISRVINPSIHINTGQGNDGASFTADTGLQELFGAGSSGPSAVAQMLLSIAEDQDAADISTSGSVTSSVVATRPTAPEERQKAETETGHRQHGQARAIRRRPNQAASSGRVKFSDNRRRRPTASVTEVNIQPRKPSVTRVSSESSRVPASPSDLFNSVSSALASLSARTKAREQARRREPSRSTSRTPTSTRGASTASGVTIVSVSSTATTRTVVSPTTTRALPLRVTSITSTVSVGTPAPAIPSLKSSISSSRTTNFPKQRTRILRGSTIAVSPTKTLRITKATSTKKSFIPAVSLPPATFSRPQPTPTALRRPQPTPTASRRPQPTPTAFRRPQSTSTAFSRQQPTPTTFSRQQPNPTVFSRSQPTTSTFIRPRPTPTAFKAATSTGWRFAHRPISWSFSATADSDEGTLSVTRGSSQSDTTFRSRAIPFSEETSPAPVTTTVTNSPAPVTVTGPRVTPPTPTIPLSQTATTTRPIIPVPAEAAKASTNSIAEWVGGFTPNFTPISKSKGSVSTSITGITLQAAVKEETPVTSQTPISVSPVTLSSASPSVTPVRISRPINGRRPGGRRRFRINPARPQFEKKNVKTPAFDLKPETPQKVAKTFTNGAQLRPVNTGLPVKLPVELSTTETEGSDPVRLQVEAITVAPSETTSEAVSTAPIIPRRPAQQGQRQRQRQGGRRRGQRRFRGRRIFLSATTTAAPEIPEQTEVTETTQSATEAAQEQTTAKTIRIRRKKLVRRKKKPAAAKETEEEEEEDVDEISPNSRSRSQPPSGRRRAFRRGRRISRNRRRFKSGQEANSSAEEQEQA